MTLRLNLTLLLSLLFATSCGLFQRKGKWGRDAFSLSGLKKIGHTIVANARDPHVWAPAAGAAAIYYTKVDQEISDWASERNMIFSNQEKSDHTSDIMRAILEYESYASLLVTPSWEEGWMQFALRKAKGASAMLITQGSVHHVTNDLKTRIHRLRPNHRSRLSMPSGHSSQASTYEVITRRNLEAAQLNPNLVKGLHIFNTSLVGAVMWARVEAQKHYPSDVLAGYALGQFLGGVIYDTLLNLGPYESFAIVPLNGQVTAIYSLAF